MHLPSPPAASDRPTLQSPLRRPAVLPSLPGACPGEPLAVAASSPFTPFPSACQQVSFPSSEGTNTEHDRQAGKTHISHHQLPSLPVAQSLTAVGTRPLHVGPGSKVRCLPAGPVSREWRVPSEKEPQVLAAGTNPGSKRNHQNLKQSTSL